MNVLESELSGPYKEVTKALLSLPVDYDVMCLQLKFENEEYASLIMIIITSRSDRLIGIKELFFKGERNLSRQGKKFIKNIVY